MLSLSAGHDARFAQPLDPQLSDGLGAQKRTLPERARSEERPTRAAPSSPHGSLIVTVSRHYRDRL
jgi:hypothetical protein